MKLLESIWKFCQCASIIHKKTCHFAYINSWNEEKVQCSLLLACRINACKVCSHCLSKVCDTSVLMMSKMLIIITTSFSMSSFKHNKTLELRFPGFLGGRFSKFSASAGHSPHLHPPIQKPDHPKMRSYGPD